MSLASIAGSSVTVNATASSAQGTLPQPGISASALSVYNSGSVPIAFRIGHGSLTALTTDTIVGPGDTTVVEKPQGMETVAAICVTGTTATVYFSGVDGNADTSGGGGVSQDAFNALSANVTLSGYQETITPLVGDNATDNAAVLQSFLAPAESNGSIVAVSGVTSRIPTSGIYNINSLIDVDPQVSMYHTGRGSITVVPGQHLPGITPGTVGTGVRTGGGAPGAMFRLVRRAPGDNKQAYEPLIGGWNIDATGVPLWDSFTTDTSGNFTSAHAHGRNVGDMIFFDQLLGAALPSPLVVGDFSITTAFYVKTVADSTHFTVSATLGGSTVVTAAGSGVWTLNFHAFRLPNNQLSNLNDPDQAWTNKKDYTAGCFHDMDIIGMPGSGINTEGGNGRLHLHSVRLMNNRLHGLDAGSNDKVFSGHWAAGGNGGFGIKTGAATGIYANTGNVWGAPANRSVTCGAWWFNDTAYFAVSTTEFNDWIRLDGKNNFNNAGCLNSNMMHPHAENFSADGTAINVLNDGDVRLQSNIGVQGYQGLLLACNAWNRTEAHLNFAHTYGNYGGDTAGTYGTAPQYLVYFGGQASGGSTVSMSQVFDGVCTAPNVKPWQGPFLTANTTTMFTNASASVNWPSHPLVVGDRVFFHSNSGGLPTNFLGDSPNQYYVTAVVDANNVQLSATYGGGAITAGSAGSGSTTIYQLSSSPYYITGNAQAAGVYVDSYRGVVNLWSVNGTAGPGGSGKFIIGNSYKNQCWEGNPNYECEFGTTDLTGGNPRHNRLYGSWESDFAVQVPSAITAANRITISNGQSKTVGAYAASWIYNVSGAPIASATINLPASMTSSYELTLIVNGGITALTWAYGAASLNNKSPVPPTSLQGETILKFSYAADNNDWTLLYISGVRGWFALTDGTNIATPAFPDPSSRFSVTLAGNRTLSNPTGPVDGQRYTWRITQDGSGSRTLAYGGKFKFAGGSGTLSTAAGTVDMIEGVYDASANSGAGIMYCVLNKAFA